MIDIFSPRYVGQNDEYFVSGYDPIRKEPPSADTGREGLEKNLRRLGYIR